MHEALFYEKCADNTVICRLCPHECKISGGKKGLCRVRQNIDGTLHSQVYGKCIAENADPIEKKPLFHCQPGSRSYSMATVGCNMRCKHCQNADISQMPNDRGIIMGSDLTPEDIVSGAKRTDCASISYTYTEPTIYFEYMHATAQIAHAAGLKNYVVSNGYIKREPLEMISPYLDGANIDLKAFSDDFYKNNCNARLQPVLDTIKSYKELGVWIEITTLLIPGLNDSPEELEQLAAFIYSVGPEIPWHVTAFYPMYHLTDRPRTPVYSLVHAREIGRKAGLRYVYTGNIPGEEGESTYCYNCGSLQISRFGFQINENKITDSLCSECATLLDGVEIGIKY